jgi:anti-sigma-K factor RskA
MSDAVADKDDDLVLAGEYVLGVLDLSERLAVQGRIKGDQTFARLVEIWENHFAGLNAAYIEVKAPNLMPKIEARLFPQERRSRSWFGWLAGGLVAAGLLGAVLLTLPSSQPATPVATLAAEAQALQFAAAYDGENLTLTRTGGEAPAAGQDYELWLIVGSDAPVSLGLASAVETTRALPGLPAGAVLAVSLEPTGGSTTGAPTGPVLVTGAVSL